MRLDRRHFLARWLAEAQGDRSGSFFVLYPLSLIYRLAVQARYALYRWRVLPTRRLPSKVLCIGNLTLGGTGKTPMVEYVAHTLKNAGMRVAVLSRGYRGGKEKGLGLVSDGKSVLLSPRESGDEPYLLARHLEGIPVLVGHSRYESGTMACRRFGTEVAILDDGYQHVQLHRDMNIVLVDGRKGFGNGHLFPLGPLREPLTGLARADQILITKSDRGQAIKAIEGTLKRWNPRAAIFYGRHEPKSLLDPVTGQREGLDSLRGREILAFAGIANPDHFFDVLKSLGAVVVGEVLFPDHHPYAVQDLEMLRARRSRAEWLVTTAKDMVRLEGLPFRELPIKALEISMEISEEGIFRQALFRGLEIRGQTVSSIENSP